MLRYFPELREPLLAQLPDQVVLDGELVIATPKGLDFDALQLRQHPAASRVKKLAVEIPASYVAFDLLALSGESLLDEPFRDRRAGLERLLGDATPPLYVTPATTSRDQALQWFDAFEGAGFDGIVAKPLASTYQPGVRAMLKVKHERTCDCVVAGYRMHKDGNGVGSLLVGLYDDEHVLHHVGVVSAMAAPLRKQLLEDVQPLRKNALADHPWREWADAMNEAAASGQRMPGGPNRWNASKDMSWEPLRIERVCEAEYEGLLNGRFRHNALPALARRQGPRRLHLRAARGGRADRAARDVHVPVPWAPPDLRRYAGRTHPKSPHIRLPDGARPARYNRLVLFGGPDRRACTGELEGQGTWALAHVFLARALFGPRRTAAVANVDAQVEALRRRVAPVVAALDLELYDIELSGASGSRILRVTVTRPGGVDLDAITAVTQAVSPMLDDGPAPAGPFLLEVSSPGVERACARRRTTRARSG